jgi:alkanesulfonate monooxygenase
MIASVTMARPVPDLRIYATCPPVTASMTSSYRSAIGEVARWCDEASIRGALVYNDNSLMDPWLVAYETVAASTDFVPLIAVQPHYQHPFALARSVASFNHLTGRRVDLNFVSGGFAGDLAALGDRLEHDTRYDRLVESLEVVRALLDGKRVSYAGAHYQLTSARLRSVPPEDLMPEIYLSGSSRAGAEAAGKLGVTRLCYPLPPDEEAARSPAGAGRWGMRIGIIARETTDAAWLEANRRFPADKNDIDLQRVVSRMSGSSWQRDLSARAEAQVAGPEDRLSPYWLGPFHNYRTFCPYLVGSYADVASALGVYLAIGVATIILDVPRSAEDLEHAGRAIARAVERVA